MFINKWVVIDSVDEHEIDNEEIGLCFHFAQEPNDVGVLLKFFQELSVKKSFAILLSGDDIDWKKAGDSFIDEIIGLFFQPSYYLVNYRPLVFVSNKTSGCSDFVKRLNIHGKKQGLQEILTLETKIADHANIATDQFAYHLIDSNVNCELIVKNWLAQQLDNKNPSEIHFLVSAKSKRTPEILNELLKKEIALRQTEDYKIANAFYQKQQLIEDYKHELFLKTISEKDTQLYLSIQKEERANGLKWYYYEY